MRFRRGKGRSERLRLMGVYIIAEVGVNHNGSVDLAKQMIRHAADAGVDAVKFQMFSTEQLVLKDAERADYQVENCSDEDDSQFDMLKKLELSMDEMALLRDECLTRGVDFLVTPFDLLSLDALEKLDVKRYKLSSGNVTDKPLIDAVAKTGKPVIMSTGMATEDEISDALTWLTEGGCPDVTLLHCTSNYPTAYADVNMRAMQTLKDLFKVTIGYSDHTIGTEIPCMAVSLGAQVIEKHITLDKELPGPDHRASLEVKDLPIMVNKIRHIEQAFGSARIGISDCEKNTRDVARKSIVTTRKILSGERLDEDSLTVKRPGTGIPPKCFQEVIGRIAKREIAADSLLSWEDLS